MKRQQHNERVSAGLAAILSRLIPAESTKTPASGIAAVELSAEQLDRVSGGMAATVALAGTTCSPCADDCGLAP